MPLLHTFKDITTLKSRTMDMPREKTTHTKPKMIHIRLSEELHQQLRIQVAKENQTIQDWVEQLIDKNVKPGRGKQS